MMFHLKNFKIKDFVFSQNLEEGIKNTIELFKSINKMELNKSFTLVLLIKGRHDFTYRWLVT